MKTVKIIVIIVIAALGIYSLNEIRFYDKLTMIKRISGSDQRPVRERPMPNGNERNGRGPFTGMEPGIRQAPPGRINPEMRSGIPPERNREMQSSGRSRGQSKWAMRLDFERGLRNVFYYTAIVAFFLEIALLLDRWLRRKPVI